MKRVRRNKWEVGVQWTEVMGEGDLTALTVVNCIGLTCVIFRPH